MLTQSAPGASSGVMNHFISTGDWDGRDSTTLVKDKTVDATQKRVRHLVEQNSGMLYVNEAPASNHPRMAATLCGVKSLWPHPHFCVLSPTNTHQTIKDADAAYI